MQGDGPEYHGDMLTHMALQEASGDRRLEVASEQNLGDPVQAAEGRTAAAGPCMAEGAACGPEGQRGPEQQTRQVDS